MEAIEFLKEYTRMCTECKDCYGCPLAATTCAGSFELSEKQITNIVEKTEQWIKEHPIMTNAKKFEEVFGFSLENTFILPSTVCNWLRTKYEEP